MVVRKMTEADLAEVTKIEFDSFAEPWSEKDFQNSLKDNNNEYLVAEIDGQVIGYCGYWGIAGEGDIFNVAVRKENRGQKTGYLMLCELIKLAKSRGIASLTLEVRSSNESAIRLYHSLGFEQTAIRKDFYTKPKEDAVIMWLYGIQ